MTKKKNYLNNKDMIKEIHKSKTSYCEFIDEKYSNYDIILYNVEQSKLKKDVNLNVDEYMKLLFDAGTLLEGKTIKATRISQENYQVVLARHKEDPKVVKKPRLMDYAIDPSSIPTGDLIFRIVTYEHIPLEPGRKKNPKRTVDYHARLNFIPFKHFIILDENKKIIKEVGRSHSFDNEFSLTHGAMTPTLANMFMLLVRRYSQRSNWRGYSYVSEMRGQSLLQLSAMGLQFDEAKSNNPFSYYTAAISNSFTRIFNIEKKHQELRDDILQEQGKTPSFTRQMEHENQLREKQLERDASGEN